MRVLMVTSDRERCGIREYGRMLKEHLGRLDVEVVEWPHPESYENALRELQVGGGRYDLLYLNHHAALHAVWTDHVVDAFEQRGTRVVVTQHDTFEHAAIMRERGMPLFRSASAWVTHEEVEGLEYRDEEDTAGGKAEWVRQGVMGAVTATRGGGGLMGDEGKPVLGLFGFDFPWKGFDLACRLAREAGWCVKLLSAGISTERAWQLAGEHRAHVIGEYLTSEEVVEHLAGCDATAFLYNCGNSGTSGAIRLGLAARRPLVAFRCRQFRDLYSLPGIYWADGEAQVKHFLSIAQDREVAETMSRAVSFIADHCAWDRVAKRYKEIFEKAIKRGRER